MQRLADLGVAIIGTQESADNDWQQLLPHRWQHFRPARARHGIILWNPNLARARKMGARRISAAKRGSDVRYIVWVDFTTALGRLRFGVTHLPAFYSSRPRQRHEYDHQEPLAAKWLEGGKSRVLVGDFNGKIPGPRTPNLAAAGRWSRQVASGPNGSKIDYVGTSKRGPLKPGRVKTVSGGSDHRYVVVDLLRR